MSKPVEIHIEDTHIANDTVYVVMMVKKEVWPDVKSLLIKYSGKEDE